MPTTTKWIDRLKKDDNGKPFVRCWQVARDFEPRREGPRDDLFAAMPPLEAKKALFAFVAGVREQRRAQGHEEVKLMFIDVMKALLNAKCDEEEWVALDVFRQERAAPTMFRRCVSSCMVATSRLPAQSQNKGSSSKDVRVI